MTLAVRLGLVVGVAVGAVWWVVEQATNWAAGGVVAPRLLAEILCLDLSVATIGATLLALGMAVSRGPVSLRSLTLGLIVVHGLIRVLELPGLGGEILYLAVAVVAVVLGGRLVDIVDVAGVVRVSFAAALPVALAAVAFGWAQSSVFAHVEPSGLSLLVILVAGPVVGIALDGAVGLMLHRPRVRLGVEVAAAFVIALVLERPMPTAPLDMPSAPHVETSRKPDVIVVVLDTTRADHLSTYGYGRETSPNLTAFAGDGLTFMHARSPAEWTLPGHASLFTGMYPSRHGVHYTADTGLPTIMGHQRVLPLSEERTTLASVLRGEGYATGGFVANFANLDRHFGIAQGFDHYDDAPGVLFRPLPHVVHLVRSVAPTFARYPFRTAPEMNAIALSWLDRMPRSQPVFLFVNYLEPHYPLASPPFDGWARAVPAAATVRSAAIITHVIPARLSAVARDVLSANYDGQIAAMDAALGQLLAALRARGRYGDALVVVTADHGELLGEHDEVGHGGRTLYEGLLHVPLVVKFPGREAPRGQVADPVQLVDVLPTVLDAVGAPVPADVQGQPLGHVAHLSFAEEDINPEFVAAFGRVYDRALVALYDGPYKLIATSRGDRMLFDLAHDGGEDHDLTASEPERVAAMAARLELLRPLAPRVAAVH